MRPLLKRPFLILASLFVTAAVQAGPTGLYLMPIADILNNREAVATLGLVGIERNVSKGLAYGDALTVGLCDRVEAGYDNDFLGSTSGNAKLRLFDHHHAALSVGVANWRGDAVDPYAVGRFDGKGYRLHAGVWRTAGFARPMLGVDFPAGPGLTGSLEYLGGPDGRGWAALFYAIPQVKGLGLQLGVGVPGNHASGLQYGETLIYGFKI